MFEAFILGIVEGLTEFIPVSSTGHLILAGHFLGFTGNTAATFEVFIQFGAILAVVALYWRRFAGLIKLLGITTLPALIVGFFAHDFIKDKLFNPQVVIFSLLLGGIAILVFDTLLTHQPKDSLNKIKSKDALKIGLAQIVSMIPGVSRSAATILGGIASGLDRKTAAEYSFLAAVPVMFLATSFDLYKSADFLSRADIPVFAVGFITSFMTAMFAIKFFVGLLAKHTLKPFGYYRIVLAIILFFIL